GPSLVGKDAIQRLVVRRGLVGRSLARQIAHRPGNTQTSDARLLCTKRGQRSVVMATPVADAVPLAGKAKDRNQHDVRCRRRLTGWFLDAKGAICQGVARLPYPKAPRLVFTCPNRRCYGA